MKILGTGLTGLIGSRIIELLVGKYEFENISRNTGVDITDKSRVLKRINSSGAQIVLHLAGKTDVDGCEKDKNEDLRILGLKNLKEQEEELKNKKTAWAVNVLGTRNVADSCSQTGKKLIYISTDFVFDGLKENYSEDDAPNPVNWYAKTKYEGEKIVQALEIPWLIVRAASPYRAKFIKLDFFRAILGKLQEGKPIVAITDHVFTPTYIDDIAFALAALIDNNSEGIFHAVGSQSLTPYDAALLIAKTFDLDQNLISKATRMDFFKNRAIRPFQLALKNDRITELGVRMKAFEEGLKEIKSQNAKGKSSN